MCICRDARGKKNPPLTPSSTCFQCPPPFACTFARKRGGVQRGRGYANTVCIPSPPLAVFPCLHAPLPPLVRAPACAPPACPAPPSVRHMHIMDSCGLCNWYSQPTPRFLHNSYSSQRWPTPRFFLISYIGRHRPVPKYMTITKVLGWADELTGGTEAHSEWIIIAWKERKARLSSMIGVHTWTESGQAIH